MGMLKRKKTILLIITCLSFVFTLIALPIKVLAGVSSPLNVKLSISKVPTLNEQIKVTCLVDSIFNAPNTSAEIILPEGAVLVNGSLSWQGNIEADNSFSFSVWIMFEKAGNWTIKANARHIIDKENWWGDNDYVYLNVGADFSSMGFLDHKEAEAVAIVLSKERLIQGDQIGEQDPLGEKPIEPLEREIDDIPMKETAPTPGQLTVKGYFYYYDRNDNFVPAKYVPVKLWDKDTFMIMLIGMNMKTLEHHIRRNMQRHYGMR